jgi:hypothetical protein
MLNRHLKGVPDGTLIERVDIAKRDGIYPHAGAVTVYWPFVVFVEEGSCGWNITHAPSGYRACEAGSRRLAVAKIQTLRALADWEWQVLYATQRLSFLEVGVVA